MSIEDPREYNRQVRQDKYESQMDSEIKELKKDLWLNDFEPDLTDKELLEICEFMNSHNLELSYIDLSVCETAEDILQELDMVR